MRHQRRIFVSIACLLALASEVPDAAEPLPLEAFASPSQMLAPDMSPDGRHVVFIDRSEPEASVAVMDVDTGRTSKVLSGATDNYRVSYCQFKNDTRVICHFLGWMKAGGGVGLVSRMVAINIDRSDLKLLSQYGNESLHQDEIIDLLRDDPRNVLLQLYEENAKSPSVFKMDVYSAKLERVVKGMEPVLNWNTDRAGAVRFGWGFAGIEPFYKTRDSEAAAWRILHPKNAFEGKEFLVYGFGVQPDKLVVSSPLNGRVAVWEMELGGSNDRQLLFSSPQFDIAGPVVWPSDGRLVGFAYYGEKPQLELFDEQARSVQAAIEKLLPGTTARVVAGSRSGQRLVIASSGDRQPLQSYLLDLQAKSLRLLRRNAPLLTTERLAEMKPVAFPGTDGVPIPAYLMLPPGAEAKNLPAVVLHHGEQFSRDIWGFAGTGTNGCRPGIAMQAR
jgi:hypothetical protein